ncbi:MAG TPA: UpxY family transcription antiterminator [Candidatus Angelobacter sp.]|nr:UpxY family transcription antiterminator [Candidatus Angelobacter sp.]
MSSRLSSNLISADKNEGQQWFAIYVRPRHEKRVAQHFGVRGIEHFLPLYAEQRKWKDGSRQTVLFPLFPNYLFVRITRTARASVLEVPGVLWIIGGGSESSTVSDSYVHFLRDRLPEGRVKPHPYLVTGKMVRIKSGAMAGIQGILVRNKNDCRVVVTLELIERSVIVELDSADLELLYSIPVAV